MERRSRNLETLAGVDDIDAVTAHLVATGTLVGENGPTKLASLVQLDPIWVQFNISERDVQTIALRKDFCRGERPGPKMIR